MPSADPNPEPSELPDKIADDAAEPDFEIEEFSEIADETAIIDAINEHEHAHAVAAGSTGAPGEAAVSQESWEEATEALKAYLSGSPEGSADLSIGAQRLALEKNFNELGPITDLTLPHRRLQAREARRNFREALRKTSNVRQLDTVLNRVLKRSSEFAVGTIRLSVVERVACLIILATTFAWFCLIMQQQLSLEALPWCVVLLFTAILSLTRYLSDRQINIFEMLNLSSKSPVSFNQSFAFSYFVFSTTIWVCLVVFHGVQLQSKPIVRRQVVDIELVSDKDFADRKEILPGTVEKPSLKSQKNDVEITRRSPTPITHQVPSKSEKSAVMPSVSAATAAKETTKTVKPKETLKVMPRQTAVRPIEKYIINVADTPQPAHGVPAPNTTRGEAKSRSRQPVLEEVAPPEMVEITENQGDNGNETFQPGGHSSGGTGRKTQLVAYLKELHRRIKHAWTPPSGETHSAEILFRIKKGGGLASIKLVTSSGDSDTDESAMHAIAACSPFKALPADYPATYLDLLYTFNYNVDELSELDGHSWH